MAAGSVSSGADLGAAGAEDAHRSNSTQIAQLAMGRTKGKHSENGEASGPNDPTPDKLDLIQQEIKDSRQAIENRLGSITAELNILRDDKKNYLTEYRKQNLM
ncbi:hypothetical protein NDU88_004224 [Pleurodeles waltl]|uniref:Uncharacterized protein n=1 Tax=Pleurodeles waltl TaxID=8319 RepID=A0AAV7M5S2_PLEWA|nr:hypothetical protein NDU88_004224 [Pleurodeles waltl]